MSNAELTLHQYKADKHKALFEGPVTVSRYDTHSLLCCWLLKSDTPQAHSPDGQ